MRTLAFLATLALAGCSTAGPFVTNISSDGNGGLIIEKCMVEHNGWMGWITNVDSTTTKIYLRPPAPGQAAQSQLDPQARAYLQR